METGGNSEGNYFTRKILVLCFALVAVAGVWMLSRLPSQREEIPTANSSTPSHDDNTTLTSSNVRQGVREFGFARKNISLSIAEADAFAPPEVPENSDDARAWARTNSSAALAWALSAPEAERRDAVAEIVCLQVAETDPARAVALAEQFGASCSNVLENLVQQWAGHDDAAASDYALNKPLAEQRDRLLQRIAFTRAQNDPAQAANLVAEKISPGEIQTEAAISVLHQWALRDTRAAAAWAQSFPEGTLRARAIQEVENLTTPPENRTTF